MAENLSPPPEDKYVQEPELEPYEEYRTGGYHPVTIGDSFADGRYAVVHKLGFGSYSTIWLARDQIQNRYVSLKVLVAEETSKSDEGRILRHLHQDHTSLGKRFIAQLLDEFTIDGPNGRHICLVQELGGCSIAGSKEDSINLMFPVETARSIAAQLIMGLSYMHAKGVCHGDLYLSNIMLLGPSFDHLEPNMLREKHHLRKAPIRRIDSKPVDSHAPPYAVFPLHVKMSADTLVDPVVLIVDYGTSFQWPSERQQKLHTPSLYLPTEDFFHEPITSAADVWTLGVSLYEILGERPLFEVFGSDRDDLLVEMISTLGMPPQRWWSQWPNREKFFKSDGFWKHDSNQIYDGIFRPLKQRLWDMGRGETPETCQWDVEGGELKALEGLFSAMLRWEPDERTTAEELLESEYMVKWAMPAWERQMRRTGG